MTNKKPRRPLVWIDCEMTGLDLEKDALVEVAVVITDEQLNIVDPGIDIVIKPSQEALDNMGDFVRKMHTDSGLIEEFDSGVSLEEAEATVLEYVKKYVPVKRTALLAGNSIGTDKEFLERDMPNLIDFLHYRVVDVSSIKELAKRWYHRTFEEAPEKHGGHRARADILNPSRNSVLLRSLPHGRPHSRKCPNRAGSRRTGIPNI